MDSTEQNGGEGRRIEESEVTFTLQQKCVYFGNRLCPFAHRSWWAACETGFDSKMDYIHIDLGARKPEWYQKRVNPSGTVPCLYIGGKPIFESVIVSEYIDEVQGNKLRASDPLVAANVKLVATQFGDKCIGPLYQLLRNRDPAQVSPLKSKVKTALETVDQAYSKAKIDESKPYINGDNISMAEIAMMPFIYRFVHILKHYRSYDLFSECSIPSIRQAYEAVSKRPAFMKTAPDAAFVIQVYQLYATGERAGPLPASAVAKFACSAKPYAIGAAAGVLALLALNKLRQ